MPDPTQPLKDVTSALENEDVVATVEKRMAETFGDVSAEDLKDEEDSTPDNQDDKGDDQADTSKSEDDSTLDEDQKNKDGTGDTDGDENKDAPSKPDEKEDKEDKKFELPDAFHRAAEHDGWKPDDIKGFFEADPERALVTFQNIYNSMNRASRDFANLGRVRAEQTRQQTEATSKADEKVEIKDFIDIAKLKEEDENNPLIDSVIKPMNDALKQVTQEIKSLKSQKIPSADEIAFAKTDQIAATKRAEATADESDIKLVADFFTAEDMKPYKDFYGVIDRKMGQIFQDLSPGQQKNRYEVLQEADRMIVGFAMQEINLPVPDALFRAHQLVTESIREKVIREEIKSSIVKRNKGLTLRPSAGKKSTAAVNEGGKPRDRAGVLANAEQRLAKVFGNN